MDDFRVTFFPPLHEQRRGWILSILRSERASSVVDIGCGEGSLLRCLCNPARFLPGCTENDEPEGATSLDSENRTFQKIQNDEEDSDLRITSIAGLDIEEDSARCSARATAPSAEPDSFTFPRWVPLAVNIFCGSLSDYNPEFANVDCIVSTEVVEHLPPSVLPHFAPMLLGRYRPRLLLITTPSYTFNARFSAPGTADPSGYPDPTQRTTRIFRHADHKFEWTPSEFSEWCEEAAGRWGYDVEVSGIGKPKEEDLWGRDEQLGWATQVAMFRRRSDNEDRVPQVADFPGRGAGSGEGMSISRHELIAEHHYDAHPRAGKPLPRDEIKSRVLQVMEEYYTEEGWTVWSLWVEENISTACGGYLQKLLGAVLTCSELDLVRGEVDPATRWRVVFSGARHQEVMARMRRENQGWTTSLDEVDEKKSQGNDQVLWEPADDDRQPKSWASLEETEGLDGAPVAIGEEVDWGRVSKASWGAQ